MKKVLIVAVLLLGLSIPSFSNSRVELPEESCKTFLVKLYNDYIFGDDYDGLKEKVDEMFTEKAKQHLMDVSLNRKMSSKKPMGMAYSRRRWYLTLRTTWRGSSSSPTGIITP